MPGKNLIKMIGWKDLIIPNVLQIIVLYAQLTLCQLYDILFAVEPLDLDHGPGLVLVPIWS